MIDILIIAPEITKGMKSSGSKALLKIKHSISVIEYQINEIKKYYKDANINIVTGFEHEKIQKIYKNSPINIIYNTNYTTTNHGEAIKLFLQKDERSSFNNLLVITNGILFKNKPFGTTKQLESVNVDSIAYCIDKPKSNFNIGYNGDENIEYLFFDLPNKWTECVLFNKEATSYLKNINNNISKMYLFEIINHLIDNDINFQSIQINKKYFLKINNTKDIPKARVFI
jgi:CTP:phosphocholine cytidylyltransferase-like protein